MDRPGLGHHVQGEVYQVDDDMLALLDEIEDVPRYYKRKLESVRIIGDLMSPRTDQGILEFKHLDHNSVICFLYI